MNSATCVLHVLPSWAGAALSMAMALSPIAAQAQGQRDPTVAPAAALSAAPAPGTPASGATAMTVIVRDGQPYLVVGTRLYAQGQMLGNARIERIGETEIWLREGRLLRRVQRFSGVQRHAAGLVDAPVDCATPVKRQQPGKALVAADGGAPAGGCPRNQP